MQEILDKAIPVAELTIIKRDLDLLLKILLALAPSVQLQMVPFSSLLCYEALEYIRKYAPNINVQQSSKYSIKEIRQKAKLFNLSTNKLFQSVDNIDAMQDKYFIHLMRFPEMGYLNLHANLGIFYDREKHIVGNSQYACYIFQDEKSISKASNQITELSLDSKELNALGQDLGAIASSIASGLNLNCDFIVSDVKKIETPFLSKDFNTNRCFVDATEKYKAMQLFLIHIQSSIGFILYCIRKMIIRDTGLLLRMEYITYHYAMIRIDNILRYCSSHRNEIFDPDLLALQNSINSLKLKSLQNKNFRNCMMHFGLKAKGGECLISEENFNLAIPFCGLVETQFNFTYKEYKGKIEDDLQCLYQAINAYLKFESLLQ